MIVVHHLENSRSQRVLWLLEELGVEYTLKPYRRDPVTRLAPPELKAVHPLGKSPVITDGETVVAETGAVIEYVLERYGHGRLEPARGTPERLQFTYWLHAAEGSMMPFLVMKLLFNRTTQAPVPWLIRPITRKVAAQVCSSYIDPGIKANLDLAEATLLRSEWFAGAEFSAADVMVSFPIEAAAARAMPAEAYPRLRAFLQRIHARDAYQRAIARGGPFQLLT